MTSSEVQEKWIQAIKDCGQSLIDNAEEISGNYEHQTKVIISIELVPNSFVEISIDTKYIPKSRDGSTVYIPSGCAERRYIFGDKKGEWRHE